jgi:hypothetical protein
LVASPAAASIAVVSPVVASTPVNFCNASVTLVRRPTSSPLSIWLIAIKMAQQKSAVPSATSFRIKPKKLTPIYNDFTDVNNSHNCDRNR